MDYPIWDIEMGGGVLMGLVTITPLIVFHFAIGGGRRGVGSTYLLG